MTHDDVPNFRPATAPRPVAFRLELRWQGPLMDPTSLYIAQGMIALFSPEDAGAVKAVNEDFAATFTCAAPRLAQLLQCLGVLRAHRIRFVAFTEEEPIDDVTERLEATEEWSYYPDPERAVRTQEAAAAAKPRGRSQRG